jgi:hypothetical protein
MVMSDLDKEKLEATRKMQSSAETAEKTADEMNEKIDYTEHYKSCWQSTVKELKDLAEYTNYLEEKIMYSLGPQNKEFADKTKYEFRKILRKDFHEKADTYKIKQDLCNYYNNM